jgi:photosystem II stability/assembly factor-like uncharacterized protein
MPPADPHRLRRRAIDTALVVLLPAVAAFAFGTVRGGQHGTRAAAAPTNPARPTVASPAARSQSRYAVPTSGAVWAGADGRTLVALTSGDCIAGSKTPGRLMSRAGGKAFAPAGTVPLAEVTSVDVATAKTFYASGLDAQCHRVHVVTTDGGRTWARAPHLEKLGMVDHAGSKTAWGLTASANAQVVRSTDGVTFEQVAFPCPANLAAPRLVTALDASTAWVVCAGPQIRGHQARLLFGTTDGGRTWRELAGARRSSGGPVDGLDADGELRAVGFTSPRIGWASVVADGCDVGEVRTTSDGGHTWVIASCPSATGAPLDRAFGVAFRDARNGVIVGTGATGEEAYETSDGGRTWHPAS